MLKVVGASLEQTRLTQFLLIIVILIAIFAIFFYEAAPKSNDGFYAATVSWTEKAGFKIDYLGQNNDPAGIKLQVARAYYRPKQMHTGWASMEIETNPQYDDVVQAKAAGLLEGSLSWQLIFWHWQNTVGTVCMQKPQFCADIKEILEENYKSAKQFAANYEKVDSYWYQVNLFYTQLEGILEGWETAKKRSLSHVESITLADILWMNHINDIRDMELAEVSKESCSYNPKHPPSDLTVLKYSPQSETKFLLTHQTAGLYSEMLRVMKKYTFAYRNGPHNPDVPVNGQVLSFTSYPGAIHSQDDFYQIRGSSSLMVVGARLKNHNPHAWNHLHLKTVFMGVRVMVANRLAANGEDWANYLSRYNSGTGNKEWLVMDHKTPDPNLWLVEQIPQNTTKNDITAVWHHAGHWISCGIPHTEAIREMTGYTKTASGLQEAAYVAPIKKHLEAGLKEVSNTRTLRELLMDPEILYRTRSDLVNVLPNDAFLPVKNSTSMSSAANEIRGKNSNKTPGDEKSGIFQKQPLIGKNLPSGAKNEEEDHNFFNGIIDMKIVYEMTDFAAIAGPLYSISETTSIPPFRWPKPSKSNFHFGQPELWDFQFVKPNFVW